MKKFDWSNLIQNLVIFCAIPFVGWVISGKIDESRNASEAHTDTVVAAQLQQATITFETKAGHDADLAKMADWNKSISANVNALAVKIDDYHYETGNEIQKVQDSVDNMKQNSGTTTTTTSHSQ